MSAAAEFVIVETFVCDHPKCEHHETQSENPNYVDPATGLCSSCKFREREEELRDGMRDTAHKFGEESPEYRCSEFLLDNHLRKGVAEYDRELRALSFARRQLGLIAR